MADVLVKRDDLDGSDADTTIVFSIGGRSYELDLSRENADTFTEVMAPWVSAARPVSNGRRRTRQDRDQSKDIRAWAKASNLPISDRGRIPGDIRKQYNNRMPAAA